MREPRGRLVLLHASRPAGALVRDAAGGRWKVIEAASWNQLRESLSEAVGVAVVDPFFGRDPRDGPAPELRELIERQPLVPFVIALDVRPASAEAIYRIGRWRPAEFIDLNGEARPSAVRRRLEDAARKPFLSGASLLERHLRGAFPRGLVQHAADVAAEGGQVHQLAERLTVSRPTLARRFHRAGLPTPRRVLMWLRVLMAAQMLDLTKARMGEIAMRCGYSSEDALRRTLKRAIGSSSRALRRRGALRLAEHELKKELAASEKES